MEKLWDGGRISIGRCEAVKLVTGGQTRKSLSNGCVWGKIDFSQATTLGISRAVAGRFSTDDKPNLFYAFLGLPGREFYRFAPPKGCSSVSSSDILQVFFCFVRAR